MPQDEAVYVTEALLLARKNNNENPVLYSKLNLFKLTKLWFNATVYAIYKIITNTLSLIRIRNITNLKNMYLLCYNNAMYYFEVSTLLPHARMYFKLCIIFC